MRIACIQMNSNSEPAANVAKACRFIDQVCDSSQPDLIVLPEFFNTLYFSQYHDRRYFALAEPVDGPSLEAIRTRAAQHHVHIVAPIYEVDGPGRYFDTAFLIGPDGATVGRYRKVHPAATNSLEKFYFGCGSDFPVWRIDEWHVGVVICYDTFFPEAARSLAAQGAELLIFPFAGGNIPLWYELHRVRAFENLAYVAVCDKVGREGDWTFGGKSVIIDPLGNLLCTAGDKDEETIVAELDRDALFQARTTYPIYRDRQPWAYKGLAAPR